MSKLDDLIKELCPQGVEKKLFNDVVDYIRGVTYNKSKETTDSDNSFKLLRANNITLSHNVLNFEDVKLVDKSVKVKPSQFLKKGDILICAGSGSREHIGKVAYIFYDMDYTFGGFMGVLRCKNSLLNSRFLFHVMTSPIFKTHLEKASNSSTINNINNDTWSNFLIPVPPLPVQAEIVRILDNFTALTAELTTELTTELTKRRQQYEHYRDRLLQTSTNAERMKLGEIFDFQNGFAFKSSLFKNAGKAILRIANIQSNQIVTDNIVYFDESDYKEDLSPFIVKRGDIVVAMSGATTGKIGVNTTSTDFYLNQRVGKFIPKESVVLNRYLYHLLMQKSGEIYAISEGGAQPNLSSEKLKSLTALIPPLPVQKRIVEVLDNFDAICSDLKIGLPAEIDARKKQYEYYRDLLLNFYDIDESKQASKQASAEP